MKRIAILFATAAVAIGLGLGAVPAGQTYAEEPDALEGVAESLLSDASPDGYDWLRASLIAAAAHTIGISVDEVKAGLRHCYSLAEIGIRHGVRPAALARGMLSYERHFLARLVEAGKLTRAEAARIMHFLVDHIDRIISFHYCDPKPTTGTVG
jgi:hypothetical protein